MYFPRTSEVCLALNGLSEDRNSHLEILKKLKNAIFTLEKVEI